MAVSYLVEVEVEDS